MSNLPPIADLAQALATGRTTSVALTHLVLDRIAEAGGDGGHAFRSVNPAAALAQAAASDSLRAQGIVPSLLAGIPLSIKDLFDLRGEVTTAGSTVLHDAPPAAADAPAVARLRAAGAVILGRTAMTEFAFSGLGLNPHFGTPGNPADRTRIPGGSSAGAAVSVAAGLAAGALGTDTGGSVRIPAAFCGLAGFKPTQARVPRDGAVPLSWSLDTVGPIARTAACCALLDGALAGETPRLPEPLPLAGLRIGVPQCYLLSDLNPAVAAAFAAALDRLSAAGARVADLPLPLLDRIPALNAGGGLAAAEAYTWHRDLLARRGDRYDPRVKVRILRGAEQSAADYIELTRRRARMIAEADERTQGVEVLAVPTVAVLPPRFEELADDADYAAINALVLRNTSAFNFLDRPAISLPVGGAPLPVGLMLVGRRAHDRRLLAIAAAAEPVIAAT